MDLQRVRINFIQFQRRAFYWSQAAPQNLEELEHKLHIRTIVSICAPEGRLEGDGKLNEI